MDRYVGQKMAQKVGYPLWMAPMSVSVAFVFHANSSSRLETE